MMWTPCSERLPEQNGWYLCTVGAGYKPVRLMYYQPYEWRDGKDLWQNEDRVYVYNHFVEAWMPLPEPYTGGGS